MKEGEREGGEGAPDAVGDDLLQERRLIVVGKTGNGKSSLGNLLLGKAHFRVQEVGPTTSQSTTTRASSGCVMFRGWRIKVLDTPDISNLADENEAQREVSTWKALTSPNAHAILLVVRRDVRYTREEHDTFLRLQKLWGGDSLTRRLIVAFTFSDLQEEDRDNLGEDLSPELQSVLMEASHRHLLFNSQDSPQGKEQQVVRLMDMVDHLDAEVLREEERRLLTQVQVCPMGPLPP